MPWKFATFESLARWRNLQLSEGSSETMLK